MSRSPTATTGPPGRPRGGYCRRRLSPPALFLLAALIAAAHFVASQRPLLGQAQGEVSIQPRKDQVFVQLSAPSMANAAANAGVRFPRPLSPDSVLSHPVLAQAAQRIKLDQERFLAECKAANISVTIDSTFSTMANLISVQVASPNHIDALRHMPGVLKVFPVLSGLLPMPDRGQLKPVSIADARAFFTPPPPPPPPPHQPRLRRRDGSNGSSIEGNLESTDWQVTSLHNLTRLTEARQLNSSLTGKDIKVGVISSGIDWKHEAFVREGEACENWGDAGCRVTHGWACKVSPMQVSSDDESRMQPAAEARDSGTDGDGVGVLAPPRRQPSPGRVPPPPPIGRRPIVPPFFANDNITCISAAESQGEAVRDACVGIGTNIASVVGGQWKGAVNGVAPQVTFGAYNIRPCSFIGNDASTDTFIYTSKLFAHIFERAMNDQMDVLVIEPTFRYGYHTQDTLEAFLISVASEFFNIPVIVPAGEMRQEESGGKQHRIESPAHATGALTVTSVTSPVHPYDSVNVTVARPQQGGMPIRRRLRVLTALNGRMVRGDFPVLETDYSYRLATSPHSPLVNDDGCPNGNHTWPERYFAGHVAVVRFSETACPLESLFHAAANARAAGVIFYSDDETLPNLISTSWQSLSVPGLMINKADGEWLHATVAANVNLTDPQDGSRARMRMNKRMWLRAAANVTVPAYNRWGPSMDLAIKPDVGCVGEHLVVAASSAVIRMPSLAIMQGTRMAAGYIAGLVALMRQQNPDMSALEIMDRVRNAGRPLTQLIGTGVFADSVIKQGAGAMVDAYSLLMPSIAVTPSKLELGDVPGFPIEGKFDPNRVAKVTMRNVGRAVEHVQVRGLFAEGVRWGNVPDQWERYMTPKTGITPSNIRLLPGEQVEISLYLNFSNVAVYARSRWTGGDGGGGGSGGSGGGGGGGGSNPSYGKRPKTADPPTPSPMYGKRRSVTRLVRRDGEPTNGEIVEADPADEGEPIPITDPARIDHFPTTDMPPNTPPMYMLSGYILFGSANSTNVLASVPFFLFAGDYRGGAYFIPTGEPGSPFLYSEYRTGNDPRDWRSYLHLPGAHVPVFNLTTRGTTPRIGFGLYQPVRKLQLDVIEANSKAFVGELAVGHFRAASQGRSLAYMYPSEAVGAIWDGSLRPPEGHKGPPPRLTNGTYMFRVRLYKFAPLTDPKRGDTPIVWTSPPFVVRFNTTSDVYGPRGPPANAVLPWDHKPVADGGNSITDPHPVEPTETPVPNNPSNPSVPSPADPPPNDLAPVNPSPSDPLPASTDPTPSPTPNPIGVIILPGSNSSTPDAAQPSHHLIRRDNTPDNDSRKAPTSTTPTLRASPKRLYILGEWTYTVTTHSSGQPGGPLVLPWDNVELTDEGHEDDHPLPLPSKREQVHELEFEDLPDFVRDEMDQYPGQSAVIGQNRVRGRDRHVTNNYRKKCIARKKAAHV